MNWFRWKDLYYPYWKHGWRITYDYIFSDIQWNPDIYFQNIKVIINNPKQKLIYMLSLTNRPDIFSGYVTIFWPSQEYSFEDLEMTWEECDEYVREHYGGQISKGNNNNVLLQLGLKRFCYYIKDDTRRVIYYSDSRDVLMNKLKINPDSLYGRNIWI